MPDQDPDPKDWLEPISILQSKSMKGMIISSVAGTAVVVINTLPFFGVSIVGVDIMGVAIKATMVTTVVLGIFQLVANYKAIMGRLGICPPIKKTLAAEKAETVAVEPKQKDT